MDDEYESDWGETWSNNDGHLGDSYREEVGMLAYDFPKAVASTFRKQAVSKLEDVRNSLSDKE